MASGKEKCISLGVLSKHVFIETFFYFIGMFVGTCMFPDHMIFVLLGQIGLIVILNLLSKDRILGYNKKMQNSLFALDNKRFDYISRLKTVVIMMTCFYICAVDFPSMDRRFAKTSKPGTYSLMDHGTFWVIFITGLTRNRDRKYAGKPLFKRMKSSFITSFIILVIGVGRMVAIELVNYHKVVDEYGVHWNFFVTLAVVEFTTALVAAYDYDWLIVSVLMIGQEIAYIFTPLGEYILHGERDMDSYLSMNKEGLASITFFTFIMIIAMRLGKSVFVSHEKHQKKIGTPEETSALVPLARNVGVRMLQSSICGLIYFVSLQIPEIYIQKKLMNISYAANCMIQSGIFFALIESLLFLQKKRIPFISSAGIDDNKLSYFLFANICTGMMNIFVEPMNAGTLVGMIAITAYGFAINFFVSYIKTRGYKLK